MNARARLAASVTLAALAVLLAGLAFGWRSAVGPAAITALAGLALLFGAVPALRPFAFAVWVFTFVAASMFHPAAFGTWLGFDLGLLIVPLIQLIMFGMGTTLSVGDFRRVLVMPWPVFVGAALQYSVMPLVGFSIAWGFRFEPEVAAGVILIGSVSGGVASNLITYLAGGNVALSVTMTTCSTMLSPVMTPMLMKILAGRLVPIDFQAMMLEILNMIVVPVLAGLVAHRILYDAKSRFNRPEVVAGSGVAGLLVAGLVLGLPGETWGVLAPLRNGVILGAALLGIVALTKAVMSGWLRRDGRWMDRALPLVSMWGICFIIAIITSRSREKLLAVGLALIAAGILHNGIGYLLGYWAARLVRLDERTCRTVAIEVGMQNGGMASGLAMKVLNSANAALAPAIFGPWMNVSGSILASWWRRRPLPPGPGAEPQPPTSNLNPDWESA